MVYAALAEQADARDLAVLSRQVMDPKASMTPFRDGLDEYLISPMGQDAEAEAALTSFLKGG